MNKVSMRASQLLAGIVVVPDDIDTKISNLALDSQQVTGGTLFLALPGATADGRAYIPEAIAAGACLVLCAGDEHGQVLLDHGIAIITVVDLQRYASQIAARFYGDPAASMTVIGVTGTNGKSSCVHLLGHALQCLGHCCGMIGTLGWGFPGELTQSKHTTPDPITLQAQLAQMRARGATHIAMEVSSHALDQGRVAAVDFNVGVFTNLTRDHLDYHGSMEAYASSKASLFHFPSLAHAIINTDDGMGQALMGQLPKALNCIGYGYNNHQSSVVTTKSLQCHGEGIRMTVDTPWGEVSLSSRLIGHFNVSNLLAVVSVLGALGESLPESVDVMAALPSVPGRFQVLKGQGNTPKVVIDYAHTPDALQQVLTELRQYCRGQLWCVFGCGGDRDTGKRAMMGDIASRCSDKIVVTDDNPRTESPAVIVQDIISGIKSMASCEVIHDRAQAIAHAIACSGQDDVVLIAGKGHERHQLIGHDAMPFDDQAKAVEQLRLWDFCQQAG